MPEPPASEPQVEGQLKSADLFVLVGLPASGKSWFRDLLVARDPTWTHVSGDEDGGRRAVEISVSRRSPNGAKLVVDRCNATLEYRKELLKLADVWAQQPVAIFFDFSAQLCISRAERRANHASIRPSSALHIVTDFARKLVAPTRAEGFSAVVTIDSYEASARFLLDFAPVALMKFPRTTHLLNLGAATPDDLVTDLANLQRSMANASASTSARAGEGTCDGESKDEDKDKGDAGTSSTTQCIITENIDGANLGFSLRSDLSLLVQNRSHWLSSADHVQFSKLDTYIERHREELYAVLDRDPEFPERYILFGEWMAATHRCVCSAPSWFLVRRLTIEPFALSVSHTPTSRPSS